MEKTTVYNLDISIDPVKIDYDYAFDCLRNNNSFWTACPKEINEIFLEKIPKEIKRGDFVEFKEGMMIWDGKKLLHFKNDDHLGDYFLPEEFNLNEFEYVDYFSYLPDSYIWYKAPKNYQIRDVGWISHYYPCCYCKLYENGNFKYNIICQYGQTKTYDYTTGKTLMEESYIPKQICKISAACPIKKLVRSTPKNSRIEPNWELFLRKGLFSYEPGDGDHQWYVEELGLKGQTLYIPSGITWSLLKDYDEIKF